MKKIVILLFTFFSFTLMAQNSKELYGKLNYTFIPHNLLTGIGYTAGYQWKSHQPVSYKVEMGMLTSFRERKMDVVVGGIHFQNLYYNLGQMNLAFIPTWNVFLGNRFKISTGLGLSGAYQSKIFTLTHYLYESYPGSWEDVSNVDASSEIRIGALGAFDVNYQLSENWSMGISAQYQMYYRGESLFTGGLKIGYILK